MYLLISNFDRFCFYNRWQLLSSMFLEGCKYVDKEKMIAKYIIDDIKISSDSDRENSDYENSDKKTSDAEGSDKEKLHEENSD